MLCSSGPPSAVDAALPYELRALEAALSAAARLLEAETSTLEARALPSLHSLTQKVQEPAVRGQNQGLGLKSIVGLGSGTDAVQIQVRVRAAPGDWLSAKVQDGWSGCVPTQVVQGTRPCMAFAAKCSCCTAAGNGWMEFENEAGCCM